LNDLVVEQQSAPVVHSRRMTRHDGASLRSAA
jgi:hypothetical protein